MWAELPDLLQVNKFQDLTDSNHTCFHAWQKTDESIFAWMGQHPDVAQNFGQWISHYMSRQQFWLPSFPLEKEIGTWHAKPDEDVLLVDVGNNLGPLLEPFKMMTTGIKGRIVLQKRGEGSNTRSEIDQTHDTATASAESKSAVETTCRDVSTLQPIKGFYAS
jgi:demethylsterigmatocystin 6-O-methyltransferase